MKTQNELAIKKCRFVLNPSLKFIFCGEDEILVLHGMRSKFNQTIRDGGQDSPARPGAPSFDGTSFSARSPRTKSD